MRSWRVTLGRIQYHEKSQSLWGRLAAGRERLFTSHFVLDETFTLLGRTAGHAFAAERARAIYGSALLTVLRPTEETELRSLDFFVKFADQAVSFTDGVSFALMRRERIRRVFSFDAHFESAGFVLYAG